MKLLDPREEAPQGPDSTGWHQKGKWAALDVKFIGESPVQSCQRRHFRTAEVQVVPSLRNGELL